MTWGRAPPFKPSTSSSGKNSHGTLPILSSKDDVGNQVNYHIESVLENIILSAKGMLLCFKNVESRANPRGERSGRLGVISNKKMRKDTDFFLGPSGPTRPWNWF